MVQQHELHLFRKPISRHTALSTSTRPIANTELFGEGIYAMPLGICSFQPNPITLSYSTEWPNGWHQPPATDPNDNGHN